MRFPILCPAVRSVRLWLTLALVMAAHTITHAQAKVPNIVFILLDDLGATDLGCYGSKFYQTPNLDKLAASGVRFTDAYAAAPVCSPTRAALLTGQYPARLQLTDWLPGRADRPNQMLLRAPMRQVHPADWLSLPKLLKSAGYTTGIIGKWHLGGAESSPEQHGFDVNIAGDQTGTPRSYFAPFTGMKGLESASEGEYLTDRLTTEAERFIEQNRAKPFFLYLPHYAVHIPLKAKEELIARYQNAPANQPHTNAIYAAMIQSMDESVGRIVKKLADLGLSENTLIVFTSDNGGLVAQEGPNTPATSNAPFNAGKGHVYEGGVRVPLIISWPGVTKSGTTADVPVITVDFFPTIAELSGAKLSTNQVVDGVSLAGLLRNNEAPKRDALYWHYPHYSNQGGEPAGAIREGDFKLIEFYEDGRLELFNLKNDAGERNNLAGQMKDRATKMQAKLDLWRRQTGAAMMLPNPDFTKVVTQNGSAPIVIPGRLVTIHGTTVRYEPQPHKNTVGYWVKQDDWVSFDFAVKSPGEYRLVILQGCGKGSGGAEVAFTIGDQTLKTIVQDTGHFQNFIERDLGTVKLATAQNYTLEVRPQTKPGVAVMDLREVRLVPVK